LPVSLDLPRQKCEPLFLANTSSLVLMWATDLRLILEKVYARFSIRESQNGPGATPCSKTDTHDILFVSPEFHGESPKLVQVIFLRLPFPLAHIEEIT